MTIELTKQLHERYAVLDNPVSTCDPEHWLEETYPAALEAYEAITGLAGTSDADWSVMAAAMALIQHYRNKAEQMEKVVDQALALVKNSRTVQDITDEYETILEPPDIDRLFAAVAEYEEQTQDANAECQDKAV